MTIRVPKRVLYTLLAVIGLAGVGLGGYAVGRHSRAGLATQLSRLERRDATVARRDAANEIVHQRDTEQLLINLCREVVRLPVTFGSLDPATCNPGALVYMPSGLETLAAHNDNISQGIGIICDMVLHVEGFAAFMDQRRSGCSENYQPLPR